MFKRFGLCAAIASCAVAFVAATPQTASACRLTVGDRVWYDANANGIQDLGETGINGVRLTISPDLITADFQIVNQAVTANDSNGQPGYYQFYPVNCDVEYTITVDAATVPAGYVPTLIHAAGSTAENDSNNPAGVTFTLVNIGGDYANMTFDFGYRAPQCTARVGDFVWFDANANGIQDSGELGISGASVTMNGTQTIATDGNGRYAFANLCAGTYQICVAVPPGGSLSPANQGSDATDSDGVMTAGQACTTVTVANGETNNTNDFGFYQAMAQPGTGTPGYWKTHPEAWPVASIVIGGISYTRDQAIAIMGVNESRDVTYILFRDLVSAKLNVLIGNDGSCVASAISQADTWMATYGPVGSGVRASSAAWRVGEPIHRTLDNYNNGMLCAPHRD